MLRILTPVLILLGLPALAEGPEAPPENGSMIQVIFACERGITIPVTYLNDASGESFAVAQIDGQQIAMQQVVSGSGARYRSIDEVRPYEIHTKGETGLVSYGPEPDAPVLLSDCTAR